VMIMMTLKTPPGPRVCFAWCMPPHAWADRPSKKYEHSSTAATKDMLVLASGSESHMSEMTVVLRRAFLSSEVMLNSSSSSSYGVSPMIARAVSGRATGWRLDLEELEGHSEPPV
jgi:hypothetical protein